MQLPRISNWQCYHQLLEAMDAPLLQAVRPFINEDMEWDKLIEQCEIHDSVRKINKHSAYSSSRPYQRPHLQSKLYTPTPPSNSSFKPDHRFDRNRKPTLSSSRFTKLTQQERDDLTKKGACFWCRKPGHVLKDCSDRKRKISSAAGTLDKEPPSEIKTTAQSIVQKATVPATKGLGAMPVLDLVKEHLLVTTKVNDQIAKTLVDQQTAGADLISSTFCTLHKIPLHKMNLPVTLQMTMKGSRGSLTHYVIVQLDWLGYLEERTMLVATLKDWDVILGSPALRDMKAIINMGTMTVSIQPREQAHFTLQQCIPVPVTKTTRKKKQPSFPKPVYAQSANQIVSAATTLKEIMNPFDKFPDVFPETKNLDLPPLRPGMDHQIQLKDLNLEIKPRNLKLKHKFLLQLLEKLRQEQKSGRVYKPNPPDISYSAIFMIPKIDKPDEARFLHDLVARNDNTYDDPPNIPD